MGIGRPSGTLYAAGRWAILWLGGWWDKGKRATAFGLLEGLSGGI